MDGDFVNGVRGREERSGEVEMGIVDVADLIRAHPIHSATNSHSHTLNTISLKSPFVARYAPLLWPQLS